MLNEFGNAVTLVTGLIVYGIYVTNKTPSNNDLSKSNSIINEKETLNNNNDSLYTKSNSIFDSNNQIKRKLFD